MTKAKRKKLIGELSVAPGVFVWDEDYKPDFWLIRNLEITDKSVLIHLSKGKKGPKLVVDVESYKKKWAFNEFDLK